MKYRRSILRKQQHFNAVYKNGKSRGSKYVVLLYRKNREGNTRVAFVASKKVGNSVQRNRARRMMREAFRTLNRPVVSGYDIIFVARNTILGKKCDEVQRSMFGALRACDLLEAVKK